MKILLSAVLGMLVLSGGIAGWFANNGYHSNPAWNHKAIANVHEASLMVGIMLDDERHAYETGLHQIEAQHLRLDHYTIYDVMKLGDQVLRQRHAGLSEIEINERADLDSAMKLINAKREMVKKYEIDGHRLIVTMSDGLSAAEEQFARDEFRSVWAVSYNQRHHWQGPRPVFTTEK